MNCKLLRIDYNSALVIAAELLMLWIMKNRLTRKDWCGNITILFFILIYLHVANTNALHLRKLSFEPSLDGLIWKKKRLEEKSNWVSNWKKLCDYDYTNLIQTNNVFKLFVILLLLRTIIKYNHFEVFFKPLYYTLAQANVKKGYDTTFLVIVLRMKHPQSCVFASCILSLSTNTFQGSFDHLSFNNTQILLLTR